MQGTVVFGAEGVLYRVASTIGASEPIPQGIALFKLFSGTSCHVICDTADEKNADMWLKLNGCKEAILHVRQPEDKDLSPIDYQKRQIERIRAFGPIWMLVTQWLELADWCIEQGLYALTFNRPGALGSPVRLRPFNERVEQIREEQLLKVSSEADEEQ
jgi:hypothetical protein